MTPLYVRAQQKSSAAVIELLNHGADPEIPRQASGSTPLHIAAQNGYGDASDVSTLLLCGANVDARNARGETPLLAAAKRGHCEVVDLLRSVRARTAV